MRRWCSLLPALALCLSLTACWEAEPPQEPQDFWQLEPVAAEPAPERSAKADRFTLPYLSSQTMDPIACSDGVQQVVGSLLYEGLFSLDESFAPQSRLCASYSRSSNGLTYTFSLRGGVTFSNGAAFTASDVLASYRRAQASERYSARFENVASMRVNRGAFVVTLKQADSAFPALLDIPIVKSGTEKDPVPLGTGPYLFLSDGEETCLVRNELWWGGTAAYPERIALVSAKDTDTAAYLFSAGQAHLLLTDLLSETSAAALGGVDRTDAPTATLLFLGFNTKNAALSNAKLRAAMGTAIDRNALVETLLANHATAAQFPVSPLSALYPAGLDVPFDSGAYAEALASEMTGVSAQPMELTLLVNEENPFKLALAEHLAQKLTAAHVTVTPRALPWAEYVSALERGDFTLWLGEVRLTPDWDITPLVGTSGALNYGKFSDAALDTALKAFLAKESASTAATLYNRFAEEAPILPLVFKSVSVLTPEGMIEGMSPTAARPLNGLENWTIRIS